MADAFAAATIRGFTEDSADAVSKRGAMTSSGWFSPFNACKVAGTIEAEFPLDCSERFGFAGLLFLANLSSKRCAATAAAEK